MSDTPEQSGAEQAQRLTRASGAALNSLAATATPSPAPNPFEDPLRVLQILMNSVEEHVNIMNPAGDVLWHNGAARGSDPNVVGRKCWEVFEGRSARCPHCVHPQILADGKGRDYETRLTSSAGQASYWWVHAVPLRDDAGAIYAILETARNITEHKQVEEQQRRQEEQLRHTQKLESLGALAGGIAHDFNNILMVILGNVDVALADLPPGSPGRGNLVEVEKAARHAAELAKQMLAYSGKGHFVVRPVRLNDVVRGTAGLLAASLPKSVTLDQNFAPDLPLIEADETQLRQIAMNLVTNAAEAIGPSGGRIEISTGNLPCDRAYLTSPWLPDPPAAGRYVYLEVKDTGCGMDTMTLARMFDPFFTTKFTGRGLGLAAVLGIVRGHQGAVRVHSQPGQGTTFQVLFPVSIHEVSQRFQGQGVAGFIHKPYDLQTLAAKLTTLRRPA